MADPNKLTPEAFSPEGIIALQNHEAEAAVEPLGHKDRPADGAIYDRTEALGEGAGFYVDLRDRRLARVGMTYAHLTYPFK